MSTDDAWRGCGIYSAPICMHCARLHPIAVGKRCMYCGAFPDGAGIPDEILHSRVDHRRYSVPGDHGRRFVPKSPADAEHAARIIADAAEAKARQRRWRQRAVPLQTSRTHPQVLRS
jgi:hypothetical protein